MTQEPAAAGGATTLTEVLDFAAAQGFRDEFTITLEDGRPCLVCPHCDTASPPDGINRAWASRLEGASDPADMATVSTLRCPRCDDGAVLIARYGPEASPAEAAVLPLLQDEEHPDRAPNRAG